MRMAGSTRRCSTATVYSPPVIHFSANTTSSTAAAARYAATRSSARVTLLMPTLEPCVAGFTISGNRAAPAPARNRRHVAQHDDSAVDRRQRLRQALGAQLVHAQRRAQHAAAGVRQCRAPRARPAPCRPRRPDRAARSRRGRSAVRRGSPAAHRPDRTPMRVDAAAPQRRQHRGATEQRDLALGRLPPYSTATLPKSRASVIAAHAVAVVRELHARPLPRCAHSGVSVQPCVRATSCCTCADQCLDVGRWPRPR
jgi:hypothetical protein